MTKAWRTTAAMAVLAAAAVNAVAAEPAEPRQPKFPLKTQRMIYTDAQIATARENVAKYPAARRVADDVIATADKWVGMSDDALRRLITTAQVPRAFDVGTVGCPKCGAEILQKHGQYGWITDPNLPFKVTCPVDGSVYPTNDYQAYYDSGFKDKNGWDTPFVDDGWGWTDPKSGEKFWFVAFYNHWMWHRHVVPGVNAMAKAYVLTGDKRYAHKAAVALARIAEVYPAMDHEHQSRYGQLVKQQGGHYVGKVVNRIWECGLITNLAQAYDAVWETIDADADLQQSTGKNGERLRAFVEANLLEEGIDSILNGKIEGNFGMHQEAMTTLALARQHGDHKRWLGGLVERNSGRLANLGLNYALYNLVYRDGVPMETAPGYNSIWVRAIAMYAPLLSRAGYDVMAMPKTKRLFDGLMDQVVARQFTPAVGDSGSVWGSMTGADARLFQPAYRAYGDARHANFLASMGAAGEDGFKSFESLLAPPVPSAQKELAAQPSRLLDGYGMGYLNDPQDRVGAAMYYGLKAGHGHFDRLNFEIFAHGVPIMPDLGYADAMNDFVPGIYTWSKNTVSHNCVVVDAKRQPGNIPGTVELFANSPFARVLDVEAKETYPQCSTYRRAMVMVDVPGVGESYFVDFFTVAGGRQHDYSLHGPVGKFEAIGGTWGQKRPGTLAGPDVEIGSFYDDPKLASKDHKTGYASYAGSGFQHLTGVVPLEDGDGKWVAQWAHERKPGAKLRIRVLPQDGQQVMLANARVSPVKQPQQLTYVIARRQGAEGLASRFVSVIEPYGGEPTISEVAQVNMPGGRGAAIEVRRGGETDVILYDPSKSAKAVAGIETDAAVAVVTFDTAKQVRRVFFAGGSRLTAGGKAYAAAGIGGEVVSTDARESVVRVKLDDATTIDPATLVGRVAHFRNDLRQTAHPVKAATIRDGELVLTTRDDLRVGRLRVESADANTVSTKTTLPLAPIYTGAVLADEGMREIGRVKNVAGGRINLTAPPAGKAIPPGTDAWLINLGRGDRFAVPSLFSWDGGSAE
jgi:hypothetical protein